MDRANEPTSEVPASLEPRLGGCVLVVGPDGAGKSTVLAELSRLFEAAGVDVLRAHHRPQIIGAQHGDGDPVPDPQAQPPRSGLAAAAKLAVVFCDHVLGWSGRWRRQRSTGVLLLERGWFDVAVDPLRYRLRPHWTGVVRRLGRLLPKADVALILVGDASSIHARKPEIGVAEVQRQMDCWRRLAPSAAHTVVEVDTTAGDVSTSVHQAWSLLENLLSPVSQWHRVPLTPLRLDARAAGDAVIASSVYRPQVVAARAAVGLGRVLLNHRLAPRAAAPFDDLHQLWHIMKVAPAGVVALQSSTNGRHLMALSDGHAIRFLVKIGAPEDQRLRNEFGHLTALSRIGGLVHVPTVHWAGEWDDRFVLASVWETPLRSGHLSVADVGLVASALVNGLSGSGPLVHGDFAPWNILRTRSGTLVVDWEYAVHARRPLFDLAHFVVQSGALLRRYTPREAAWLLCAPNSPGARHLAAVGENVRDAPDRLLEYLSIWEPRGPAVHYHKDLRRQVHTRWRP